MIKRIFIPVILFALCVHMSGCKKDNAKKEYCRITKLIKNGNEEIDIKYGDNEKVSAIENMATKELSTYKYSKDTVFITASKNGNFIYKLIVTNNKDHLASNVMMEWSPVAWVNQAFTYEGKRIVHNKATNADGETESASYIWENGNIDVLVNEQETIHYEYYTDKNFQDGDFHAIQQLLAGYRIYEYKNLVKSSGTPNPSTYYTYIFDEQGRVAEATATKNNNVTSFKIEYDCQ